MARGETFLELQTMLREELNRSQDVSIGVDDLPILKRAINKSYATLYDEHDWPFLRRIFPRVSLAAGQRFYGFPTGLNIERVERAEGWQNGIPRPLTRGIGTEHYAAFDSLSNERSDPVVAWDVRDVSNAVQFEVWPLPVGNDQSVEFTGIRSIDKLVNNADVCYLDDELVVLFAASQHLRRQKSADADEVLAQFRARFQTLKGRSAGPSNGRYRNGIGSSDDRDIIPITRATIRISG